MNTISFNTLPRHLRLSAQEQEQKGHALYSPEPRLGRRFNEHSKRNHVVDLGLTDVEHSDVVLTHRFLRQT